MADLTQTRANVAVGNNAIKYKVVQVGEAVLQGQPGYLSGAKYYQTDANDGLAKAEAKGIFLTPAATDGWVLLAYGGDINLGATLVVGTTYCVSRTKGAIMPAADLVTGDAVTHLGIAITTALMRIGLNPSGVLVP